jgi:hypothetical protein
LPILPTGTKFKTPSRAKGRLSHVPALTHQRTGTHTVADAKLRLLLSNRNNRETALRILFSDIPETVVAPEPFHTGRIAPRQHRSRIPIETLAGFLADPSVKCERHLIYLDNDDPRFVNIRRQSPEEFIVNTNFPDHLVDVLRERLYVSYASIEAMTKKGLEILTSRGLHIVDDAVHAGDPQWKTVEAPDEVTGEVEVQFVGEDQPEGEYIAATPATDAMGDSYPVGAPVIFRTDVQPQEGSIVLAEVVTKPKKPGAEEKRAMLLRRYATDAETGLVVLRSETKGYPAVKEGATRTESTSISIMGVATAYKPSWTESKTVGRRIVCRL